MSIGVVLSLAGSSRMASAVWLLALTWCLPLLAAQTDYAKRIAPLIDPAKLATLGKREANQRVEKTVH
jgi:hypothetical protein